MVANRAGVDFHTKSRSDYEDHTEPVLLPFSRFSPPCTGNPIGGGGQLK